MGTFCFESLNQTHLGSWSFVFFFLSWTWVGTYICLSLSGGRAPVLPVKKRRTCLEMGTQHRSQQPGLGQV